MALGIFAAAFEKRSSYTGVRWRGMVRCGAFATKARKSMVVETSFAGAFVRECTDRLSFSWGSTVRSSIQPRRSLFLLSCQHLTAVCMHIFSFTYTFSWHMHAHLHRHTCLSHARTHTRSNATVVTGFCSSFPLYWLNFPFPCFLSFCYGYFVKSTDRIWRNILRARRCC